MAFQIKRKEVASQGASISAAGRAGTPINQSQRPLTPPRPVSSPHLQTSPVSPLESSRNSRISAELSDVSNTAQTSIHAAPSIVAEHAPAQSGTTSSAAGQKLNPAVSTIPKDASTPSESSKLIPVVSEKRNTKHDRSSNIFKDWVWEITAALFSILCLIGICILLAYYDGKATPEIKWGITLNAVVALLATLMKGSLLAVIAEVTSQLKWLAFSGTKKQPLTEFDVYDSASRGGVGSMMFIWHHKKKFWHDIVFVAAIFGVLSIGISAFSQQLIRTSYDRIEANSTLSTIVRSTYYNEAGMNIDNRGIAVPERLYPDMSAALYSGIYGSTITTSDLARCETENCTYPITPSLAICSKCVDISSKITFFTNTTLCRLGCLTLPNGPSLIQQTDLMQVSATANASQTIVLKDLDSLIVAFRYINGTTTTPDVRNAVECALYFCVQAYNTTVIRGNVSQEIVETWSEVVNHYVPNSADYVYMRSPITTLQIDVPNNTVNNRYEELYGVRDQALWAFKSILPPMFSGTIISGTHGLASGINTTQDSLVRLFYASPSITDLVNRIAESMTASIRRSANPAAVRSYSGTRIQLTPTIHIDWPWIALPASVVLFAALFLCYGIARTAIASRSSDIKVWKSSQLPMLYHGLHAQELQSIRDDGDGDGKNLLTVKEMQIHAEAMLVSMRSGRDGLKLSTI